MFDFKSVVQSIKDGSAELKKSALQYKNKGFLNIAVGGSVFVAYADGTISSEEKKKMMVQIQHHDALSVFDTADILAAFREWDELFSFDVDVAKTKLFKELCSLRSDVSKSRTLVRIFISIGASDGEFDNDEKSAVREMCIEMGTEPSEFQL